MRSSIKQHLSCNFIASLDDLHRRELSIMEMYEKLKYGNSTQFYEVEEFRYAEIPKTFPNIIKNNYTCGIFLERFTFFEMLTIFIFQYLYTSTLDHQSNNQSQVKELKINELKSMIYSDDFMEGNYFMKGLIIKGFKLLEEAKQNNYSQPLSQVLLTTDIIVAFTECWKQLIDRICVENNLQKIQETEIDSSIFEILANYFRVDFDIHWKEKGKSFWKEHFSFEGSDKSTANLAIIVNPQNQISISQRSIHITESRASCSKSMKSSSISNWNYIILSKRFPPEPAIKSSGKKTKTPAVVEVCEQKAMEQRQVSQPAKLHNDEISRISEAQFSCGQTQEIKILLEDNNSEQVLNTQRKTPTYGAMNLDHITFQGLKQRDHNEDLNSIWKSIEKGNSLIDGMRQYSEFLQDYGQ